MLKGFLCPRLDSNQHTLSGATTSKWCVYQFRHPGIAPSCGRRANVRGLFFQDNSKSRSFSGFGMLDKNFSFVVLLDDPFG